MMADILVNYHFIQTANIKQSFKACMFSNGITFFFYLPIILGDFECACFLTMTILNHCTFKYQRVRVLD